MNARRPEFTPAVEVGDHDTAGDAGCCQGVAVVAAVLATHGPAAGGATGTVPPMVEQIVKRLPDGGHVAMAAVTSHTTPSLAAAITTARDLQRASGLPGRVIVRQFVGPA